jgi:hypothetical protein
LDRNEAMEELEKRFWQRLEAWRTIGRHRELIYKLGTIKFLPWYYSVRREGGESEPVPRPAEVGESELHKHHIHLLERVGIRAGVELAQEVTGSQLIDLTWTESFEATLTLLLRKHEQLEKLVTNSAGDTWRPRDALQELEHLMERVAQTHVDWQRKRKAALKQGTPSVYQERVRQAQHGQGTSQKETTRHGRRQCRTLRDSLASDKSVVDLREKLRIPDGGFQDVQEAAYWLYDRDPPFTTLGPVVRQGYSGWAFSRQKIPLPAPAERVPALARAARCLCRQHSVGQHWVPHLCFYLLRNQLDPVPRQRSRRR